MTAATKPSQNVRLRIHDGEATLWGFQHGNSLSFTIWIKRARRCLFGPEIDELREALAQGDESYTVERQKGDERYTIVTGDRGSLTIHSASGAAEIQLDDDGRAELQRALDDASDATAAGSRAYLSKPDARPYVAELQELALSSKAETDVRLAELRGDG